MVTRRSFLKLIGIAPVAIKLAPFIELPVFAPPVAIPTIAETLNSISLKYYVPALADAIFQPSPMFLALKRNS